MTQGQVAHPSPRVGVGMGPTNVQRGQMATNDPLIVGKTTL